MFSNDSKEKRKFHMITSHALIFSALVPSVACQWLTFWFWQKRTWKYKQLAQNCNLRPMRLVQGSQIQGGQSQGYKHIDTVFAYISSPRALLWYVVVCVIKLVVTMYPHCDFRFASGSWPVHGIMASGEDDHMGRANNFIAISWHLYIAVVRNFNWFLIKFEFQMN